MALLGRREAFERIHFPPPEEPLAPYLDGTSVAHRRLAFDELFFLHLGLALRREGARAAARGTAFEMTPAIRERLKRVLPFKLTAGQRQALKGDPRRPALAAPDAPPAARGYRLQQDDRRVAPRRCS
jgi:ATP-dependent DNA helicase RecG